jgi:maltooligosyltrehalose synthase
MNKTKKPITIDEIIEKYNVQIIEEALELRKKVEAIDDPKMRIIAEELMLNIWKRTNLNYLRIFQLEKDLGIIEEDSEEFQKIMEGIIKLIEENPIDLS